MNGHSNDRPAARIDMLRGPMLGKILLFALPLAASSCLQQLFNSVDVAVAGRFAGREALAAVGSNASVISLMINLFVGISMGVNVVIANHIGQDNPARVRRAADTALLVAAASGLLLMTAGYAAAGPILRAMDTPADILAPATRYLRIIFLGMPFMMVFNFSAAILRSLGDTRRPLYILTAAGVVNTGLNLFLVVGAGMGVEGVAIATVVAHGVSAGLVVRLLRREQEPIRLHRRLRPSRRELRRILGIGVPAGIQGMVFSLANVFIQTSINGYGSAAVAGSAAALNYEYYCYFFVSAFAGACVTFVSQNYGARQYGRCRTAVRQTMGLALASCLALNLLFVWQEQTAIGLFTTDAEAFVYGAARLETVLLFQWIACSYEITGAALRGLGRSALPAVLTVFGTCALRLAWVYLVAPQLTSFRWLLAVYPLSWVITGAMVCTAYARVSQRLFSVVSITH